MGKIRVDLVNPLGGKESPWDFGRSSDDDVSEACARALFDGGLPLMWRQAYVVLDMIFELCALEEGARVFLIGEALQDCGFVEGLKARVGETGEVTAVDIGEDRRAASGNGAVGRDGQRGTLKFDYFSEEADQSYDAVVNLQGVSAADDWSEVGAEMLRILKPGCPLVMAQIGIGAPEQVFKVRQDLFLDHVMSKILSSLSMSFADLPYHGPEDLRRAFGDRLEDQKEFEWRGLEVFWGRKPSGGV